MNTVKVVGLHWCEALDIDENHHLQSAHQPLMFLNSFLGFFFLFQVKDVYLQFMMHCYIDTDAEMKDVYNVDYIEQILGNMLADIQKVSA